MRLLSKQAPRAVVRRFKCTCPAAKMVRRAECITSAPQSCFFPPQIPADVLTAQKTNSPDIGPFMLTHPSRHVIQYLVAFVRIAAPPMGLVGVMMWAWAWTAWGWGYDIREETDAWAFVREVPIAAGHYRERVSELGMNARGEYLVVWEVEQTAGDWDVWARRAALKPQFHWLGPAFPVAESQLSEEHAAVAYDPVQDTFLVVYQVKAGEGDHDIWGQRVKGQEPVDGNSLVGAPLAIGYTTGDETAPDVAFLPGTGQFLVVYTLHDDIWARRVARTGQGDGGGDFFGDEFPIATTPEQEHRPVVKAALREMYFLVGYQVAFSPQDDDLVAQRVRGKAQQGENPLLGPAFGIASSMASEENLHLAYALREHAWFAVWQDTTPIQRDVRGVWLDAQDMGTDPLLQTPFAIAAHPQTWEQSPDAAVDPLTGDVVVTFTQAPGGESWSRGVLGWLEGEPSWPTPALRISAQTLPRPCLTQTPRVLLAPGSPRLPQAYTLQWGLGPDADTDAYLAVVDRWSTVLPRVVY